MASPFNKLKKEFTDKKTNFLKKFFFFNFKLFYAFIHFKSDRIGIFSCLTVNATMAGSVPIDLEIIVIEYNLSRIQS